LGASRNRCCRGKAIGIKYSECVPVALVIQHAKRMHHVMLSSVACLDVPYLTDGTFVQELLNTKRVFLFSRQFLSEKLIILKTNAPDIITNVHRSSWKEPISFVKF
jgi:hypothetical protein